jgi:outer membrane autotransporter protein
VETLGLNGGKSFTTIEADNITVVPSLYSYTFAALDWDGTSAASLDLRADSNLTVVSDDYSYITLAMGANAYVDMEAGTLTLAQTEGSLAEAVDSGDIRLNFNKDAGTFAAGKNTHLIGYVLAAKAGTVEIGLGTADSYFTGGANDYTGLNAITDIPDTTEEDTGTPYDAGSGSSDSDSSSDSASGTDTASADDSGIAAYSDTASSDTSDSTAASGEGSGETASSDADIAGAISIYAGNGAKWDVRLYNDGANLLYSNIALYSSSGKDANGFSSYVDLTNETAGQNLFIEKLTGSDAQFILRTQVDESRYPTAQVDTYRDHVIIQEGHGDHYILVKTVGNSGVENDEDWVAEVQADYLIQHYEQNGAASVTLSMDENGNTVVTKPGVDGALSFTLANSHQAVDYNNRHYVLQTRDVKDADGNKIGTEWYLRYAGEIPDYTVVPPEEPSDFVLDQNFENLSNPAQLVTTLAGFGTMYSAWTANLTDLRKRLGEVRYGAQDGLWARGIWQKDTTDGLTGGKFEQKLKGIQIGADHIVTQNEDRMWLVGANFKYADGDQKVKGMDYGRGDMKTYGAFLYATYANYKGYYTDLVLSIDHYNEKMRAQQSDYTMTHGSYNTWGWGASVETGRMFSSTQSDEGWGPWYANWWVEPQLQLSYYWGKGKSFKLDNGMTVEQKNGQSLIGRAGVVIGKKYNYGKNRKEVSKKYSQFYVKGGVKQEFLGDQKLTVNGEKFSGNLRGPRVYYGAGMDWNLADNLRVYAQVEREQGSKYKRDYEVSVGLKWQF